MYELIQAGPRSFYINSPVKIGVYLIDDEKVCLIDSGNDKDAGRKVRQIPDQGALSRALAPQNQHAPGIVIPAH